MGGRGASSGISDRGNEYGSQYKTLLSSGNVKFVQKNNRTSETLMETMTRGRVYVTVGGNELMSVIYFDNNNKRTKTIDLNHVHAGMNEHVHHGYSHNEVDVKNNVKKKATHLTPQEEKMVEKVRKIWYNYLRRKP